MFGFIIKVVVLVIMLEDSSCFFGYNIKSIRSPWASYGIKRVFEDAQEGTLTILRWGTNGQLMDLCSHVPYWGVKKVLFAKSNIGS